MSQFSEQKGGKTIFGATVGILMLHTRFPRIPGDIGNALTWSFPVHYKIVKGATPNKVVLNDARLMLQEFIEAGQELVDMGCDGITTNCGFLSLIQDELKNALGVPVAASSLMQIPLLQQTLPAGKRIGILTVSGSTLTDAHLLAAGVSVDTAIMGTESGKEFSQKILGDNDAIDFAQCRLDLLDATRSLLDENNDLGAIVLECTNMVPYAADIRALSGLPVFSIYSFVNWFQQGLSPHRFPTMIDDSRHQKISLRD
jgi:Asp/Glu/hydantoin racemase